MARCVCSFAARDDGGTCVAQINVQTVPGRGEICVKLLKGVSSPRVLAGPVLGRVTVSSFVLMLEVSAPADVEFTVREPFSSEVMRKRQSLAGGVPEFVRFDGLRPERRYLVSMAGLEVTQWRCGPPRPVFGVVPEHLLVVNTLPLVPASCAIAFVADCRADAAQKGEQTLWVDVEDLCSRAWHGVDAVVHVGGFVRSDAVVRRALLALAYWRDLEFVDALRSPIPRLVPATEEEAIEIEAALLAANPHEPPRLGFGSYVESSTLALLRCIGQSSVLPVSQAARYCSFGHAQLHLTTIMAEGAGLGLRAHAATIAHECIAGQGSLVVRGIPVGRDERPVPVGNGSESCVIHRLADCDGYQVIECLPPAATFVNVVIETLLRDMWRAELTAPYARGAMMRASHVVLASERDCRITVPLAGAPSQRFTVKLPSILTSIARRVSRSAVGPHAFTLWCVGV